MEQNIHFWHVNLYTMLRKRREERTLKLGGGFHSLELRFEDHPSFVNLRDKTALLSPCCSWGDGQMRQGHGVKSVVNSDPVFPVHFLKWLFYGLRIRVLLFSLLLAMNEWTLKVRDSEVSFFFFSKTLFSTMYYKPKIICPNKIQIIR